VYAVERVAIGLRERPALKGCRMSQRNFGNLERLLAEDLADMLADPDLGRR
jgi:hypothetical protein